MTLLVLLSLVTYRVTRFLINDTLINRQRIAVENWLLRRRWLKIVELISCPWCVSVWIAAGVTFTADLFTSVPMPWLVWPATSTGAMLCWRVLDWDEPDDDD